MYFRWVIYCNDDKIAESSQIFPNENEAAADCEKHFEETNFYLLFLKNNSTSDNLSKIKKANPSLLFF